MNKFETMMILSNPKISATVTAAQAVVDSAPAALRKIALDPEITTKTQVREAVRTLSKADRGSSIAAAVDFIVGGVWPAWNAMVEVDESMPRIPSHPEKAVPMGPEALRKKLLQLRHDAVWEAFCESGYRWARHYRFLIEFGAAGVDQEDETVWDMYAKSYGYPGHRLITTITVPADWRMRVQRHGLAVLDGLFTLEAVLLDARVFGREKVDIKIYAAAWLGQGRGNELHTEHGFIAVGAGKVYHSLKSPDDAARGLVRAVAV